jgi:hypothetical protein
MLSQLVWRFDCCMGFVVVSLSVYSFVCLATRLCLWLFICVSVCLSDCSNYSDFLVFLVVRFVEEFNSNEVATYIQTSHQTLSWVLNDGQTNWQFSNPSKKDWRFNFLLNSQTFTSPSQLNQTIEVGHDRQPTICFQFPLRLAPK